MDGLYFRIFVTISFTVVHGSEVFYVSSSGSFDSTCGKDAGSPCANLTQVIEHVHGSSSVTVCIAPGSYELLPTANTIFNSVSDVSIVGSDKGVVINCTDVGAGIAFKNCNNITIRNLALLWCGMEHQSTNRDFEQTNVSFIPLNATLYFINCTSSMLDSVTVNNSFGYAVVYYTTTGINSITHSLFANNSLAHNKNGGAVLIEFPYCLPGDNMCSNNVDPEIPPNIVSTASYHISDCQFVNNYANSDDSNQTYFIPYKSFHNGFGRGGGISIYFKGKSQSNSIFVDNCNFTDNFAEYGGGISCAFEDCSYNNSLQVQSCIFFSNTANHGGAMRLAVYSINDQSVSNSSIVFEECTFVGNSVINASGSGGGISVIASKDPGEKSSNSILLKGCDWTGNKARLGAAVDLTVFNPVTSGSITSVTIENCNFKENSVRALVMDAGMSTPLGMGAVYQDSVTVSYKGSVYFHRNYDGSALVVINAQAQFMSGTYTEFFNNTARNGGAIGLLGNAYIVVWNNTQFNFTKNTATNLGGAIFNLYSSNRQMVLSQNCFISYYNSSLAPTDWITSFVFQSNSVQQDPNAIFSTTIKPCLWGRISGPVELTLLDPLTVFCWNSDSAKWLYDGEQNCSDQILTYPASFNSNDVGLDVLQVTAGQQAYLPFVACDDQQKTVTDQLVFIPYSKSKNLTVDKHLKYISNNTNVLNGEGMGNQLQLQTGGPRVLQTRNTVNCNNCPLGFYLNSLNNCTCIGDFGGTVKCNQGSLEVSIVQGYWIGNSSLVDQTVVVHCIYCNNMAQAIPLNNDESSNQLCYENRTGTGCSDCPINYSLAVNLYSIRCVSCQAPHAANYAYFFFVKIILPLLFIFFLYITNLSLTSGLLNGAIFFAQIVPSALTLDSLGLIPYYQTYNNSKQVECVYKVMYGVWNLEFDSSCFSSLCLHENNDILDLLMLNYLIALFPILLVVAFEVIFSCASWGPFNRILLGSCRANCHKFWSRILRNERGRKTRVSCILLSYVRIAVMTTYILTPTNLLDEEGKSLPTKVLFFNASCEFFGAEHKQYAIPVFILSSVFLISIPFLFTVLRYENPDNTKRTIDYFLREFQQEYRHSESNLDAEEDFDVDSGLNELSQRPFECCQEYTSDHMYSICSQTATALCSTTLTTSARFNTPTELCSCKITCCSGRSSCLTSWSHEDYRWFAGWYFIARLVLLVLFVCFFPMEQYVSSLMVCMILVVLPLAVRPYVNKFYNYLDSVMFMLLGLIIVLNIYQLDRVKASNSPSVAVYWIHHMLVLLPAGWIYLVIVYQIWKLCKAALPGMWIQKLFKNHSPSAIQTRVLTKSLWTQHNVPLI